MAGLRFLSACLALGAIGHFGSEALFWTAPPPDLGLGTILLTVLVYALAASVGLSAVLATGCTGWPGLFLGGALMGFSVEGAIVATMYDAFPVQLVWTPLAWHALLTAGLLLGGLRRLARGSLVRQISLLVLIGAGFGVWGGSWTVERPDLAATSPGPTLAYLGGAGLLAIAGQIALDRIGPLPRPPLALLLAGPALVALLWIVGTVTQPSPLRLAGPMMAWASYRAMRALGAPAPPPLIWPAAPAWRHGMTMILPLTAALVAGTLWRLAGPVETNWPVALATGTVAPGLWLALLWRGYRRAASASPRSSAPS